MKKRGFRLSQAALEFLMTYGWIITTVFVAISALAYFGVLSPDKFVPRKCVLESGIGCMDFKVQEDSVTLVLRNGKGEDITISRVVVGNCSSTNLGSLLNGEQKSFTVTGCSNTANEKYIGDVNITYRGETGLEHKGRGSIVGKTEAGSIVPTGSFYWITTTQQEFDEGSYTTTQSIPAGSVQLDSAQNSGAYTSKVFDAGKTAKWSNISWGEPLPYKEHLEPDGTSCQDSGVKGLWYLDESSGTAKDSSYCGKNGNNAGATQGADGKIKTAYSFDGVNDYINMEASLFPPVPAQLTTMAWAKTMETNNPQNGEDHLIFYHGWDGEFNIGQGQLDDTFFFSYDYTPDNQQTHAWDGVASNTYAVEDRWYHIAVIWDSISDKAQLFVNGILDNEKALQPNWELWDSTTYHPTTIGAKADWDGARVALWNGNIDEVAVYNKVLSPSEILNIYKQGILNLYVEVRSCDDPNCDGESFSGSFTNSSTQDLNVPDNRYIQYRVNFESEDLSYTPLLEEVAVGYTVT